MTTIDPPPLPPPSRAPTTPFLRTEEPAMRWAEVGVLIGAGFLVNLALRGGVNTLAATAAVMLLGAGLLWGSRLQQRSSRLLVVGAMALSPWLMIRASIGLTVVTVLAVCGLLALAVGLSRVGRLWTIRVTTIGSHLLAHLFEWAAHGLPMFRRLVVADSNSRLWIPLVRGVAFALPVVGLFAILLASADQVFSNLLSIESVPSVLGHIALTGTVIVGLFGVISRAAHETAPPHIRIARCVSPVEINVVLGCTATLFAAFVATQIAVALGGVDHVLETEGLTQAEHARSGFFQLLWVVALTLGMLGMFRSFRSTTGSDHKDRFVPLATTILALTLVITGISIQRLSHYVGSFGLTPLRFWSMATAGWIGILVVGYAASIYWARRGLEQDVEGSDGESWFPAFLVISATVFVFGLNAANPDAYVARYNVSHTPTEKLDTGALTDLSADVISALTADSSGLLPEIRADIVEELCRQTPPDGRYSIFGWNAADADLRGFFAENCSADDRARLSD